MSESGTKTDLDATTEAAPAKEVDQSVEMKDADVDSKETQIEETAVTKDVVTNNDENTNNTDNTANDTSSLKDGDSSVNTSGGRKSRRRTVNLGLDGNYWHQLGVEAEKAPKRKRKTVERLYVGDVVVNADDEGTKDKDDITVEPEPTKPAKNEKRHSPKQEKGSLERRQLYKPKSFIAVRNESSRRHFHFRPLFLVHLCFFFKTDFFLCQTVNAIYEDTKRVKIQWLEEEHKNEYRFAYVDWIEPQTIITTVQVIRIDSKLVKIENEDIERIEKLLDHAIKHGGIIVGSESSSEEEASSDEAEEEEETSESESEDDDKEKKQKKRKTTPEDATKRKVLKTSPPVKKEILERSVSAVTDPYTFDDDRSSGSSVNLKVKKPALKASNLTVTTEGESPKVEIKSPTTPNIKAATATPTSSSSITITAASTTNTKTHLDEIRNKVIANLKKHEQKTKPGTGVAKVTSPVAEISKSLTSMATNKIKKELGPKKKIVRPRDDDSESSGSTEHLEDSDSNDDDFDEEDEEFQVPKKKVDLKKEPGEVIKKPVAKVTPTAAKTKPTATNGTVKSTQPKTPVTTPKSTANKTPPAKTTTTPGSTAQTPPTPQQKKKLMKAISNRHLEENEKVTVLAKDPFFEDTIEIPFVSAQIQSKLAFRAIYTNDMPLLKKLIDDKKTVSSLACEKTVYNKQTPLHLAITLGNKAAVELLLDEHFAEQTREAKEKRIEMPQVMLSKFDTGEWNPKSFNAHYIRPLAQSRGCKEGNNAFLKDTEKTRHTNSFDLDLIQHCFKTDCSTEIFDSILQKYAITYQNQEHRYKTFVHQCIQNIQHAVLYGNRKLASFVFEKCEQYIQQQGFNTLHVDVLKFDNDEDLKTQQLRMQTCVKKAFMNDAVTPLHFACSNTNTKYLKTLLNITHEFNLADKRGRKLIHYAAASEGPTSLEYLLARGISQYESDSSGNTPLHYACMAGRSLNVEILLRTAKQKHEDVVSSQCTTDDIFKYDTKYGIGGINKPNRLGKNALHLAVENCQYDAVKVLIKYDCNLDYPMSTSFNKITALMYAVQLGNFRLVQMLHENGARIESRDRLSRTPSILASMCGSTRILSYLLRNGSNPNAFDSSGNTCIHYACAYGWYFCVRLLIDAGAQVNAFNDWKLTPFGIAFLKGHIGVCEQLLGHKIDINFRTENGETLIMLVVSNDLNKATVDQLNYIIKKLNADCSLTDSNGNNALHYLAKNANKLKNEKESEEKCRQEMATLLIQNKCSIDCDNNQLETPIFLAIKQSNTNFAKYLLLNHSNSVLGGEVIKRDLNDKTLLHLICEHSLQANAFEILEDEEFVKKYTEKFKVMANLEDDQKRIPIHLAFIALKKFIEKKPKGDEIPKGFYKFIESLYLNFNSNINTLVSVSTDEASLLSEAPTKNNEPKQFTKIPPLFLLTNDSCCELLQSLAKISTSHADSKLKIDFDAVDNNDCTLIHKSIILKEHKLCKLLISLRCFNLEKKILTNNLAKKLLYLHENLLHICIRYKLFDIYDLLIEQLYETNENFLIIIQPTNLHKQNILHLICSLLSLHERVKFGVERLERLFSLIKQKLGNDEQRYEQFRQLYLNVQDVNQRTPLHLCLLNRDDEAFNGNIDLELFLVENGSNLFAADHKKRIPLHYLFCSKVVDENLTEKKYDFNVKVVDPIELLTVFTKLMGFKQQTDLFGDLYGLTPLHYAAMRGSTICCLHIIEHSAHDPHHLLFKQCNRANTPLSLAIYHDRDTCLLTLLKQTSGGESKISLKTYYHHQLPEKPEKETMLWTPKTVDANLYPLMKQTLYELILKNNWEGINWLILENLEKYTLNRLDTVLYAIKADNYSLALRLIEKYERFSKNSGDFYQELLSQSSDGDTKRTLLHHLCLKPVKTNKTNELVLTKILNKLFLNENNPHKQQIKEFYLLKDSHNSTAVHYACMRHNFFILDYLLKSYPENAHSLLISKDAVDQTAFALLFWSIGRVQYTTETKEKISLYYKTYMKSSHHDSKRLNDSIKAYYRLVDLNNFGHINQTESISDYPNDAIGGRLMVNPLLFAINRQDLSMCKYLIKELNFDVNSYDGLHVPAIIYAIRVNNIDLVRLLLNLDYDPEEKLKKVDKTNEKKVDGTKARLNTLFRPAVQAVEHKSGDEDEVQDEEEEEKEEDDEVDDDDEDDEEEEEEADDSEYSDDDSSIENKPKKKDNKKSGDDSIDADKLKEILNPVKFQIESNINLFHLDSESRSLFHHLACTLDYGSYSNLNICKLLLYCKKKFEASRALGAIGHDQLQIEQQQTYFNDELKQFIKHLDKKSNTAIDYAIKYGNYELADELRKFLNRDQQQANVKSPVFYVNDPYYAGPNAIQDYRYDSDQLLRRMDLVENEKYTDMFTLDKNCQMDKNGELCWDKTSHQPYDCLLTKTDVTYGLAGMHNFYKMQLIKQKFLHVNSHVEQADSGLYILFTRWGRIGSNGQFQRTPFPTLSEAIVEFCKIFKQKTGNDFNECVLKKEKAFEMKPKKYNLISFDTRIKNKLTDFNFDLPTSTLSQFEQAIATGEIVECKIKNIEYIEFFLDLCDSNYLKQNAKRETKIAFDYIPLTRLSRQTIENAFDLLTNEIKALIDERFKIEKQLAQNKTKESLNEYMNAIDNINKKSNQYYQLIPQYNYEFDMLNPIATYNDYDEQLSLILQLIDYQYAIKILMGANNSLKTLNPIDYIYNTINCKLQYLNENETEAQYILRYIWSSTKNFEKSGGQSIKIERIFKFEHVGGGGGEEELALAKKPEYKPANSQNRYLLWHGTSTENMLSIMSKGLIKCPFDSRKHGTRFGKGIYTSDVFTMSAAYAHGKRVKNEKSNENSKEYEHKYMLLCEVSLGNVYEITGYQSVESAPKGYDSVKVIGQYEPNEQYTIQLPNGVKLPLGNIIQSKLNESNLQKNLNNYEQHNQYVVYDESQVTIRYIVQFRQ